MQHSRRDDKRRNILICTFIHTTDNSLSVELGSHGSDQLLASSSYLISSLNRHITHTTTVELASDFNSKKGRPVLFLLWSYYLKTPQSTGELCSQHVIILH